MIHGSTVDRYGHGATFDWGTARLYLKVYPTKLVADAGFKKAIVDDLSKQAPRIAGSRVEPLVLAKPLVGYAVIPRTPAREDELVYAAYIASDDDSVDLLVFYVDVGGVADQTAWIDVAKGIVAATTAPLPPPMPPLEKTPIGSLTISLPHGTRVRNFSAVQHFFDVPHVGTCSIAEDGGTTSRIPEDAKRVPGHVLGELVDWVVWEDDGWWETVNVATIHLLCSAEKRSLARMRGFAESLAR